MSFKGERDKEEEDGRREGAVRVRAVFSLFLACEGGAGDFKASLSAAPGGGVRKEKVKKK